LVRHTRWSTAKRYATSTGNDPLDVIGANLARAWGVAVPRHITWPLFLRVARITPSHSLSRDAGEG